MEGTYLLIAISLVVVILAYELVRAGLLTKIEVKTIVLGPYLVLYKNAVGTYRNTGKVCLDIHKLVVKAGLVHKNDAGKQVMLGMFFDDPSNVPTHKLRSSIGYVFKSGNGVLTPEEVTKQKGWLSQCSVVKSGELKIGYIPASQCVAASYPFTNMLSVILGVMRIYPTIYKAFAEACKRAKPGAEPHGVSSLEVYMRAEKRMWISFPLTNRTEMLPFDLPEEAGPKNNKEL